VSLRNPILLREGDDARHALGPATFGLIVLAGLTVVGYPLLLLSMDRMMLVSQVSDDAYYYFNVARHIAAGAGPTADGITVTTGWHPLYGFILAGLHCVLDVSPDGFVKSALLLNAVCFALTGGFLLLVARRVWGELAGWCAGLLWWTNPHAVTLVSVGLEGSVYGATLAFFFWRLVDFVDFAQMHRSVAGRALLLGVSAGLVLLSRTDAIVLLPLVALVLLVVDRGTLSGRAFLAVLVCGLALVMLGGWWYYAWKHTGSISQGSGAIKRLWRESMNAERGMLWAAGFTLAGWAKFAGKSVIKVPALKWVLSTLPPLFRGAHGPQGRGWAGVWLLHLLWVFPIGLGLAYALLLDRPRTWYYVPSLVGMTLLASGAARILIQSQPVHWLPRLARRCLPLLAWLVLIESAAVLGRNVLFTRSRDQVMGALAAKWVDEHIDAFIAPGEHIGCWHSGIVQYYTPRHTVINLDGLANNEILPVLRGEKTMNAYWDERKIRAILGAPREKMGDFAESWGDNRLVTVESFRTKRKSAEVRVIMSAEQAAHWEKSYPRDADPAGEGQP
jgi:hypothetical protein